MAAQRHSNEARSAARAQAGNRRAFEKTRLCTFYQSGKCLRGPACTFAHSEAELAVQPNFRKSKLCADFANFGFCAAGAGCNFAHGQGELRRPFVPKKGAAACGGSAAAISCLPVRTPAAPQHQQHHVQHPASARGEQDEMKALRAQIEMLQMQIDSMEAQQTKPTCQAPAMEACKSGFKMGGVCGGVAAASTWSRQSTAEPTEAVGGFERQMSLSSGSSWADELDDDLVSEMGEAPAPVQDVGVSSAETEKIDEEVMEVALVVKHTFVSVVPRYVECCRLRSLSSPPTMRRHPASA